MRSRKSCEIANIKSKELICLPGIETNISISQTTDESIHFICIFKEGKSSEDIERIFQGASGLLPYDDREVDTKVTIDISKFVKSVHENDGICIASHVNDEKGLRNAFYDTDFKYVLLKKELKNLENKKISDNLNNEDAKRLELIQKKCQKIVDQIQEKYLVYVVENEIDAVQVQKSSDFQFYMEPHTQQLNIARIAAILSTDAHCLDAIGWEQKVTYVKMEKCNFANLKAALYDPQTRIRYSDNVKTHNFPKIKGLIYLGEDGFFRPFSNDANQQVLGFADNLTCFIGGRGSGKSAAIDSLRYVFKDKKEIESLRKSLKEDVYARSDHTLKNTALYILMESSDGTEVVVNTFYQGWDLRSYESCFMDGSNAGIDLSASTDYRVEIYGWSEIEDLGTDSVKQRELLDKFIPEIYQIKKDISEIKTNLETNRNDIIEASKELEGLIPGVKGYSEAKAAFDRINTKEIKGRFEEIDSITEKQTRLKKLEDEIEDLKEQIDIGNVKIRLENIIDETKKDLTGELKKWAEETLGKIFKAEEGMDVLHKINELLSSLNDFFNNILQRTETEETKLDASIEELKTQLSAVEGVSVELLTTIEKRKAYKKRYDDLKETKENIKKKRKRVYDLFSERANLLKKFVDLQNDGSAKRLSLIHI